MHRDSRKKPENHGHYFTSAFHCNCDGLGRALYVQVTVFRMSKQTFASGYAKLRTQRGHYIHVRLLVDKESWIQKFICKKSLEFGTLVEGFTFSSCHNQHRWRYSKSVASHMCLSYLFPDSKLSRWRRTAPYRTHRGNCDRYCNSTSPHSFHSISTCKTSSPDLWCLYHSLACFHFPVRLSLQGKQNKFLIPIAKPIILLPISFSFPLQSTWSSQSHSPFRWLNINRLLHRLG